MSESFIAEGRTGAGKTVTQSAPLRFSRCPPQPQHVELGSSLALAATRRKSSHTMTATRRTHRSTSRRSLQLAGQVVVSRRVQAGRIVPSQIRTRYGHRKRIFGRVCRNPHLFWLPPRDSNPDMLIQSQRLYRLRPQAPIRQSSTISDSPSSRPSDSASGCARRMDSPKRQNR